MTSRARVRLTRTGTVLFTGALVLAAAGLWTGYREFVLLALSALLVVILASLIPRVTSEIHFTRLESPRLVERGAVVPIEVLAAVDHLAPPTRVYDQLAGVTVPFDLPQLSGGSEILVRYHIKAVRRGIHQIGPLMEQRTDPFGLATKSVVHDVVSEVLVHPRVHSFRLPTSGSRMRQARAYVPRMSEDPLADFRSLREYVVGDDARLVHWTSTAKTGALMVRDHFELRRTTRLVVLDTLDRVLTETLFEDAVEIAASIVCESLEQELSVTLRTRDPNCTGRRSPVASRQEAMELLARVTRTSNDDTLSPVQLHLGRDPSDQVFVIAGAGSPLVVQLAKNRLLARHLIVIRLDDGASPLVRLPVRTVEVRSAEQLAARWNEGSIPL